MPAHDNQTTDHLDDAQLLARELIQHDEFRRLTQKEPQLRDTTYGATDGTREIVASWELWWDTQLAAQMRRIPPRPARR